jgi:histidine ammonia-lyase
MFKHHLSVAIAATLLASTAPVAAAPAPAYQPIIVDPAEAKHVVTLTGHDLTLADVIAVAHHGAKIRFGPQVAADNAARQALLKQGDKEGMAIYAYNRGAGALREQAAAKIPGTDSQGGAARYGALPEIDEEALVRAFLVIQANHLPYGTSGEAYLTAVTDLLNKRVTPVMYSRGTLAEGDLFIFNNYHATLRGRGFAYFGGVRMPAAEALAKAGLKPFTGDLPHLTTNAYTTAVAAMLVVDGEQALSWADMALAIDLTGMNSSVTPLTPLVQSRRPFAWVSWEAEKVLGLLRDSYLFQDDKDRILQDPESLRASYIRLGSAWEAWARLRDSVTLQMNSGENNPAHFVDAKPQDHWSLSTPWLMRYHVRGDASTGAPGGYILSNANWDAYPMTNDVEAFNLALANMAVTVAARIDRFSDRGPVAFFTGVKPADVLTPEQYQHSPYLTEPFFTYLDVWKEMQTLTQSVPPDASSTDFGVADLEGMGRLKAARGRQAIDLFLQLTAYDLLAGTYWMDVRKVQDKTRSFGAAPTAAWQALRKDIPFLMEPDARPDVPLGVITYDFMKAHPAAGFMQATPPMPAAR